MSNKQSGAALLLDLTLTSFKSEFTTISSVLSMIKCGPKSAAAEPDALDGIDAALVGVDVTEAVGAAIVNGDVSLGCWADRSRGGGATGSTARCLGAANLAALA